LAVPLRNRVKRALQRLSGLSFERVGDFTLVLYRGVHRQHVWYSYGVQLRSLLEQYEIDCVVDVGANEGQFARHLRSFYRGTILSFEPVKAAFERLSSAARGDPSWRAFNCALGRDSSTASINVSGSTVFSSLLKANEYCEQRFGDVSTPVTQETVSVRRLDDMLEEQVGDVARRRIFLKMDTQGFDREVFAGAERILPYVSVMQSEVSLIPIYESMPHWTDSLIAYERAGFGILGMFPVTRDRGRVIEYDCLLARADAKS